MTNSTQNPTLNDTLTRIPGVAVGHTTDAVAVTGCTVILCPEGTVGGVDQRGGAPGSRETDLLRPLHLVEHVDAFVLAGGSAYGLAAADGVMRFLEEQGRGYKTVSGLAVPIVPAAILFDLAIGSSAVRPDADMGYSACLAANTRPVLQGSVGAGTGCRVGTLMGNAQATKSGIGSASLEAGGGLVVAALVAVNAFGDVIDEHGEILAGLRSRPDSREFPGTLNVLRSMISGIPPTTGAGTNTVIGVVMTTARLSKEQVNKVAQMAHDGLARAVHPAHTMYDGDTLFAAATGVCEADVSLVGALAADAVSTAIRRAVVESVALAGVKAVRDLAH